MQANHSQIQEMVIGKLLAAGLRPAINKEKDPKLYGEMIELYLDAIYELKLSPKSLHDGMMGLLRQWMYRGWPTIAQLLEELRPPPPQQKALERMRSSPKSTGDMWAEEVMRMPEGQEALKQGYGRELYLWAKRNQGKIPDWEAVQSCAEAELAFRANFRKQIDLARNLGKSPQEPMKSLVHAVVLNAATAMDGLENKLKKEFLQMA